MASFSLPRIQRVVRLGLASALQADGMCAVSGGSPGGRAAPSASPSFLECRREGRSPSVLSNREGEPAVILYAHPSLPASVTHCRTASAHPSPAQSPALAFLSAQIMALRFSDRS